MPDGLAANHADSVVTLSPPIAAPLPGASVSLAVIGSPASSVAETAEGSRPASFFFCSRSAGASFLRKRGTVWTTDKDGILLALLASEITAVTGRPPSEHYAELTSTFGAPEYKRSDAAATREQKATLSKLSADQVSATELAGEAIVAKLTEAPGNGAAIGGLKVVTETAWFAARPSGTEDVYKVYAESFRGPDHLARVQEEAKAVVSAALGG